MASCGLSQQLACSKSHVLFANALMPKTAATKLKYLHPFRCLCSQQPKLQRQQPRSEVVKLKAKSLDKYDQGVPQAVHQDNPKLVNSLVAGGADIDGFTDGLTALQYCASHHRPSAVQALLSCGADIHQQDAQGRTALALAAAVNDVDIAEILLSHGANVNHLDKQGLTILHTAVSHDACPELVATLLSYGADASAEAHQGVTPLHLAAASGNLEVAKVLWDIHVSPATFVGGGTTQATPLEDSVKMAQMLLSKGVSVVTHEPQTETVLEQLLTCSLPCTTDQLQAVLQQASNSYYNGGEMAIPDALFDQLKDTLQRLHPTAPCLTQIGAPVVGNRLPLPFGLYSLDKVKPGSKDLSKWQARFPGPYCISDKLDGTSCLIVYEKLGSRWRVKLFTRGDGVIGGDISHMLPYVIPHHLQAAPPGQFDGTLLAVRGEIIISKQNFSALASTVSSARSLTNGMVNRKSVDGKIARKVDCVVYEVVSPRQDKASQIEMLSDSGFCTVDCLFSPSLSDVALAKHLDLRRHASKYELDGLVVESNGPYDHGGKGNPDFAFAFKKSASDKGINSKVIAVLWQPSKDGLLKPRVQYEPIKLDGVVMQFATAHNARYIRDNAIGPGAVVEVIRSGDVVPQLVRVVTPAATAQMPDLPYTWSKTGVDAVLADPNTNDDVQIRRLVKFFAEMAISDISKGLVTRFWAHGFQNLNSYLEASVDDFMQLPGVEQSLAAKLHTNVQTAIQAAPLLKLMKASNAFAGGVGVRKLEAIFAQLPDLLAMSGSKEAQVEALVQIDGVQQATAEKVVLGIQHFKQFPQDHPKIKVEDSRSASVSKHFQKLSGTRVVFSGVRDKDLVEKLTQLGGIVTDSMSSKTTMLVVKSTTATTGKTAKAEKMGITVMNLQEFQHFLEVFS